ncbi:GGDEF domain-containing protein [Thiorhodococcus minor]|uniref:diguanylate cyclase n=1 Tax=Thiorhodococcus minor TaxID=57489 RepID=A0A6M0K542_9GAMM|nr:GGDEF domain-containing protein [Thiorhodococcus minor]NEV64872.1 GGDEF domain-containing protein [Thiorhodococcus minor]
MAEGSLLGRLGGEEFAVLLPFTGGEGAIHQAELIRERVAATVVAIEGDIRLSCTLSIGVGHDRESSSLDHLLKLADDMLYHAKGEGRNRIVLRCEDFSACAATS